MGQVYLAIFSKWDRDVPPPTSEIGPAPVISLKTHLQDLARTQAVSQFPGTRLALLFAKKPLSAKEIDMKTRRVFICGIIPAVITPMPQDEKRRRPGAPIEAPHPADVQLN